VSIERPDDPAAQADREATRGFGLSCLALFAVATGVRLLHVAQLRRAPFFDLELGDAHSYAAWAREIASGDWLGSGVFYQAPFYPYFLGSVYTLVGDDALVLRCVQALLGAGSCVLLADAGRRLFSARAGLFAGAMLAVYAPAIFFDGLIQKASLGMFLLCLALWLTSRLTDQPRRADWVWLGVVMGALVLTRENALAIVFLLAAWLWIHHRHEGARRWIYSAAMLAGLATPLAPVALRNYSVAGEWHLTTSQLGPNFYIGNNRDADGVYMPLQRGRGDPRAEQRDARRLAENALGRELSAGEVSDYWVDRSLEDIREDPARWVSLLLRKLRLSWNAAEIGDTEFQDQHARWSLPLRTASHVAHFGWIAPLAVLGLWASWADRRRLWIFYAILAGYTASVVLFYVLARYRYPLVPLLLLFGGAGLAGALRALRDASPRTRAAVFTATVLTAIYCNLPTGQRGAPQWVSDYNVGTALLAQGENEAALQSLRRALQEDADEVLVRTQLGIALHSLGGRSDEAIEQFDAALALDPDFLDAHIGASRALVALGRESEALAHLRRAGEVAPGSPRPLNNAAWLLATSSRIDARTARRSLRMAQQANELSGGNDLLVLDTLAAAHAANAEFDQAVSIAEAVQQQALAAGEPEFAASVGRRLELYRRGQRFVAIPERALESR
jgi:4-amino-4-deoxy-L-arabinose transferase-like glycosyltransferase